MKWIDTLNIAISLAEKYPHEDVRNISFTDLKKHVITLNEFDDDSNNCNEKILESIQQNWLDEIE
jgi:FeS assembly protein IscX